MKLMAKIYQKAFFDGEIRELSEAKLSIASSAVLYGLSVYTVLPVHINNEGQRLAFRLSDHFDRLIKSARIIGIDTFETVWSKEKFTEAIKQIVEANNINNNVFIRATVHVDELIPGTKSRGLKTNLSIFVYDAEPILSEKGVRLKTSVWRRIPDNSIPSRAKVNGAYVNSVLAKQDAIDSGYDDCIFLDVNGHVCELSAANVFIVRDGKLITPSASTDLLEGINRKTALEIAKSLGIKAEERNVDLTELYIADEIFASGTSAYIAPVFEVDARVIGDGKIGSITSRIRDEYNKLLYGYNGNHGELTFII